MWKYLFWPALALGAAVFGAGLYHMFLLVSFTETAAAFLSFLCTFVAVVGVTGTFIDEYL